VKKEKRVITYGTFDMFHIGHLNLLKRAKELGGYLIVGVTSESYDRSRGKLNVSQDLQTRMKVIQDLPFVDEVIVETHKGQKEKDIQHYEINLFVIGDDWLTKFDYLNQWCRVIYLPRTQGVSSSLLRENIKTIRLGIIGTGRIAQRFIKEALFVKSVEILSVYSKEISRAEVFIKQNDILYGFDNLEDFLDSGIDAVYIASTNEYHYEHCKRALLSNKHILCEKPVVLKQAHLIELTHLAQKKQLVFMEGIKTAYTPCFIKLLEELKSGIIGEIKEVRSTFTKLILDQNTREWSNPLGGATNELASYTQLICTKILGISNKINFYTSFSHKVDSSNIIISEYDNDKIAISTVAIGRKSDGSAIISGTQGYIFVPAPWWLTKEFFVKFENPNKELTYRYEFEGDGLRYEISEFISCINRNQYESKLLTHTEMLEINKTISLFNQKK